MARPKFKPTENQRIAVEDMVSCGDADNEIARQLKIDEKTLRRYFADELKHGARRAYSRWYQSMCARARAGSVSAQKFLLEKAEFDPLNQPRGSRRLGAKEAASRAAIDAEKGTSWETILPRDSLQPTATPNKKSSNKRKV